MLSFDGCLGIEENIISKSYPTTVIEGKGEEYDGLR